MRYEKYSALIDEIGIYGVCIKTYDSSTQRQTITPICFREREGEKDEELDFKPQTIQNLFREIEDRTPKQRIKKFFENTALNEEQKRNLVESLV